MDATETQVLKWMRRLGDTRYQLYQKRPGKPWELAGIRWTAEQLIFEQEIQKPFGTQVAFLAERSGIDPVTYLRILNER